MLLISISEVKEKWVWSEQPHTLIPHTIILVTSNILGSIPSCFLHNLRPTIYHLPTPLPSGIWTPVSSSCSSGNWAHSKVLAHIENTPYLCTQPHHVIIIIQASIFEELPKPSQGSADCSPFLEGTPWQNLANCTFEVEVVWVLDQVPLFPGAVHWVSGYWVSI